jgi:hypothetical protein
MARLANPLGEFHRATSGDGLPRPQKRDWRVSRGLVAV